jgi:hypothetical protein
MEYTRKSAVYNYKQNPNCFAKLVAPQTGRLDKNRAMVSSSWPFFSGSQDPITSTIPVNVSDPKLPGRHQRATILVNPHALTESSNFMPLIFSAVFLLLPRRSFCPSYSAKFGLHDTRLSFPSEIFLQELIDSLINN